MNNLKQINDEISVAMTQVTPEELQQAAQEGFKSVLNLRSPDEEGVLPNEQKYVESSGLEYVNIPLSPNKLSDEKADEILETIEQLKKPLLLHCKSGMRSGAMALMYMAIQEDMSAQEAIQQGKQMGFDCDKNPKMKEFFKQYVSSRSEA